MPTSSRSALSVVVAANGAHGAVERLVSLLEPQLEPGDEVLVCGPAAEVAASGERPGVRAVVRDGVLVPVLWRDGILEASGAAVVLTISPMLPAPDWLASLRAALDGADAVGGAIEPADDLRLVDRAEHLARYARDMLPFAAHDCLDLPGDNAAYDRAQLLEVRGSWADGFEEPRVHRALAARGARLVHDPEVVVQMGRSAGLAAFVRQRWAHGRMFARGSAADGSRGSALARLVAAPIVPVVLLARALGELRRRGRLGARELAAVPVLLVFDVAWAAGEAAGYLGALAGRR